jgi:hypothetical protein
MAVAVHGQELSDSSRSGNCIYVRLSSEEQAFWGGRIFKPIWKDSCDRKMMTGLDLKCALYKWADRSADPNTPNDLEHPMFNWLLDDKRYVWDLAGGAEVPDFKVPHNYTIIEPEECAIRYKKR